MALLLILHFDFACVSTLRCKIDLAGKRQNQSFLQVHGERGGSMIHVQFAVLPCESFAVARGVEPKFGILTVDNIAPCLS